MPVSFLGNFVVVANWFLPCTDMRSLRLLCFQSPIRQELKAALPRIVAGAATGA
jgi:hypothetical protein